MAINVVDFLGGVAGYSGEHQFSSNLEHRPSRGVEFQFAVTVANDDTADHDGVVSLENVLLRLTSRHFGDLVENVAMSILAELNFLKGVMPRGQDFSDAEGPGTYKVASVPASGSAVYDLYLVHMFEDRRFKPAQGALPKNEIREVKLSGNPALSDDAGGHLSIANVDVRVISYGFEGKDFLPAPFKVSGTSASDNPAVATGKIVDMLYVLPSGMSKTDKFTVTADGVTLANGDREIEYYGLMSTLDMDHDYRSVLISGMDNGVIPVIRTPEGGAVTKCPERVSIKASQDVLANSWAMYIVSLADREGKGALKVATEQQHSLADFQPIIRLGTRTGAKRPPLPGLIPYRLR